MAGGGRAGLWTRRRGYRSQLVIDSGTIRIFTRRGVDWTAKYKHVLADAATLKAKSAIIDGEMVVLGENGVSDFRAFRRAIKGRPASLVFVAFDLMHLDGGDLRDQTVIERRDRLHRLVEDAPVSIQFSPHVAGGGKEFYSAVDTLKLEGMVSKRRDSAYRSGRTTLRLKTKSYMTSDLEVAGVVAGAGKPTIALMVEGDRNYVGGAFVTRQDYQKRLLARVTTKPVPPPKGLNAKPEAQWLEPGFVARVRHLRGEEELRHASVTEMLRD